VCLLLYSGVDFVFSFELDPTLTTVWATTVSVLRDVLITVVQ